MQASGRVFGWTLAVMLCLAASQAWAGGFAVARFGGEHGHAATGDPTAIYYNPAGLALESGHRIMLDANLAWRTTTYDRAQDSLSTQPPSDLAVQANTGEGSLSNLLISPFLGFATDFGTGLPFGVGLAVHVPFGGQSVWDSVTDLGGAPGAVDGPQRFYIIEGTIRTFYFSLGGAYRIEPIRLSIGLVANLLTSEISTLRARNADGSDDIQQPNGDLKEGRAFLDATSTDWSLGFGLLYEPIEDTFWIGASYQSQPNFGTTMQLTGTMDQTLGTAQPSQSNVVITQDLPDVVRLAFRYRPMERLELRLFGDYQRWSTYQDQCVVDSDRADNIESACEVNANGNTVNPDGTAVIQNLARHWEDTFGVRGGASYWLNPDLELIAGLGYDSNAVPDAFLEASLPDWNKITASLGARVAFTDWFAFMLTVTNVFYMERDTTGQATAEDLGLASRQPNSAGVYSQNVLVFNTNFEFSFGGSDDDEEAAPASTPEPQTSSLEPAAVAAE